MIGALRDLVGRLSVRRRSRAAKGGGAEPAFPRTAILVLGMHRSGTSALTRLIGALGAALPSDAIAAHADNGKGFWESAALVKADDQLLRVARSSWFDPRPLDLSRLDPCAIRSCKDRLWDAIAGAYDDAPLFVVKDPRQCRFVPLMVELLAERGVGTRAVLVLREPGAIARSLGRRDGTTPAFVHLLWLRHMIDAERETRGLRRTIVDYDAALADWRGAGSNLLPLVGRARMPEGEEAAAIEALLDRRLRHHAEAGPREVDEPLAGIVDAVDAALRASMVRDDAVSRAALDAAAARLDAVSWLVGDIIHDELRHRRVVAAPADPLPVAGPPNAPPDPEWTEAVRMVRESGLFDARWYVETYPDVAQSGLRPIEHYLMIGAAQGRDPHPLFDTVYYARQMARRIAAHAEI